MDYDLLPLVHGLTARGYKAPYVTDLPESVMITPLGQSPTWERWCELEAEGLRVLPWVEDARVAKDGPNGPRITVVVKAGRNAK